MLQKRRLFSNEKLAEFRKPQYKVLDAVKGKAIKVLTEWFLEEYDLPGCQARTLSEEVIDRAIKKKQKAISPSAPDVYLPERDVLESVLSESKALAMQMDENGELEKILDNEARHEEYGKHGI
jgi:hypothetical protein